MPTTDLTRLFAQRLDQSLAAISTLRDSLAKIANIAELLQDRLAGGGTMYTCGNGGSAAEALHFAEELIGRYRSERPALRAVCLNADPTALTCIANDFGFASIFERQCAALLSTNDVLVVFSTSGNSENIVRALRIARERGVPTIGFLGGDGGACRALCDHTIIIASNDSAHVQEAHQVAMHLLCEALEQASKIARPRA